MLGVKDFVLGVWIAGKASLHQTSMGFPIIVEAGYNSVATGNDVTRGDNQEDPSPFVALPRIAEELNIIVEKLEIGGIHDQLSRRFKA